MVHQRVFPAISVICFGSSHLRCKKKGRTPSAHSVKSVGGELILTQELGGIIEFLKLHLCPA